MHPAIQRHLLLVFFLGWGLMSSSVLAKELPSGQFTEHECIACHEKENAALVADWRRDRHALSEPVIGCVDCHGRQHESAASHARQNHTCTRCHGGEKGAVAHSYNTSKHGVIYRIEESQTDESRPFKAGNYRSPGCAYCHASGGEHDMGRRLTTGMSDKAQAARSRQQMRWVCQHCHGPRLIQELENNGQQMLALGTMKLREAEDLVNTAREEFPGEPSERILALQAKMKNKTYQALSLGIAHQSPDYQWWHGHPALDGDLIRIKGALTRLRRVEASVPETSKP